MPDIPLTEDQATLYVLGELPASERCEFEARLAESAELRALVRELEEGAMATAMASPQRRVPQKAWERIEKAVAEESKPHLDFSFWFGWLRNGWAVAAACLVGWVLYGFWVNRPTTSVASLSPVTSATHSQQETTPTTSERTKTETARRPARAETDALLQLFQSKTQEIGALRGQIVQLTNQVTQLSEAVDRQQGLLSEPDRLKFFQLVPGSEGGAGGSNAPVSPALQRALFLAMARELGWLGSPGSTDSGSTLTNQGGVDFVDLRPGTNETPAPIDLQSPIETEPATPEPPSLASAFTNPIPGFVSGTSAFVALDSSVVSPGTPVTLCNGSEPYGTFNFNSNPTVVAFPCAAATGASLFLTFPGGSNTIPYFWNSVFDGWPSP